MPGPLLFFIIIIVVDLVLKTSRDKRKIEAEKHQNFEDVKKPPANYGGQKTMEKEKTGTRLITMIQDELEKERQKEELRRKKDSKPIPTIQPKVDVLQQVEEEREVKRKKQVREKVEGNQRLTSIKDENLDIKKEILKGIIFSEILSEPKSIQNYKKRSM